MGDLEKSIEEATKVEASARGGRLFKNEIGLAKYQRNGKKWAVAYGVGGPGAPDLMGWVPVVITPDMVGQTLGLFVAVEMKKPGKKLEKHQNKFRKAALVSCPSLRIGWADSVEGAMDVMEGLGSKP